MRLEDRIEQIRADIDSGRYTTAVEEAGRMIEIALREIYRRSLSVVDGPTRRKVLEAETRIGGSGKSMDNFTLGQMWAVFREAKLFDAYAEAKGTPLRALTILNFDQIVDLRNRLQHQMYEASKGEAQIFLHCVENMIEGFGIVTLGEAATDEQQADNRAASAGKLQVKRGKRRASSYDPHHGTELSRLQVQGALHRPLDMRMLAVAVGKIEAAPVPVIDIGCAQGEVTVDRFGALPEIGPVLGVDRDERCIEEARAMTSGNRRYRFEVLDVEAPDADERLRDAVSDQGGGGPMLVFSALTLHHLAAPEKMLRMLRRILPPGSCVVLRTFDDGTKLGYPDNEQRLAQLLEFSRTSPSGSDRQHGRKLFFQMRRAGFTDIEFFSESLHLLDMDPTQRRLLFEAHFSHRRDPWIRAVEAGHPGSAERLERVEEMIDEIEADLADPAFFYFESLFGAVAICN